MGDYSHKSCGSTGCEKPPVCKFYFFFDTDYFCIDHITLAYDSFEPDGVDFGATMDRAGKTSKNAWSAATKYVADELGLPADAEFSPAGQSSMVYNNTSWIVRGDVTVTDTNGKTTYYYYRVELSFTGGDDFHVWDFKYEK